MKVLIHNYAAANDADVLNVQTAILEANQQIWRCGAFDTEYLVLHWLPKIRTFLTEGSMKKYTEESLQFSRQTAFHYLRNIKDSTMFVRSFSGCDTSWFYGQRKMKTVRKLSVILARTIICRTQCQYSTIPGQLRKKQQPLECSLF